MNSAGEDKAHLVGGNAAVDGLAHHADRLFPEDEAGPRAHVPAAFAPLEHESARAVAKVLIEQARRRDMQIGGDSLAFQAGGLVGAPAGEKGKRRPEFSHDGQLLGTQLGRHETQNAHAPGPSRKLPGARHAESSGLLARATVQGPERASRPPRATAWANPGTSLTRVIGPWRTGKRVPWATARAEDSASGRAARAAAIPSAIARSTAWTIPPTVT